MHVQQLLEQPASLSRALVCEVFPQLAPQAVPLGATLGLMLECEKRLRARQRAAAAPGVGAAAAGGPPAALLDHNLSLLLSLRAAHRYLHKAAPGVDPRSLLLLSVADSAGSDTVQAAVSYNAATASKYHIGYSTGQTRCSERASRPQLTHAILERTAQRRSSRRCSVAGTKRLGTRVHRSPGAGE